MTPYYEDWAITKSPYFAQDDEAILFLYGFSSDPGPVCLGPNFSGNFYYHNGESWAMVGSSSLYCADSNVLPPSTDLIPDRV